MLNCAVLPSMEGEPIPDNGEPLPVEPGGGILEMHPNGYGFLRSPLKDYVLDAGLGSEMALTIRDFNVLLSVIYAHTVHSPNEIKGSKVLLSIRTIR